jgi:hypothetical protein
MALEAAERALALEPEVPEAHFAKGWYLLAVGTDFEQPLRPAFGRSKACCPIRASTRFAVILDFRRSSRNIGDIQAPSDEMNPPF